MRERPIGVTILAILAILAGLMYLLGSLALFGVTAITVPGLEAAGLAETLGISAAIVLLVMAVLDVVFGVGALGLRTWAWWLGVFLVGITLIANVFLMFTGALTIPAVITAIVAAAVLGYMFTDRVREAFGIGREYYSAHHGGPVVHA